MPTYDSETAFWDSEAVLWEFYGPSAPDYPDYLWGQRAPVMLDYLPPYWHPNTHLRQMLQAEGYEFDAIAHIVRTLLPTTVDPATCPEWALDMWETLLSLPGRGSWNIDDRRAAVQAFFEPAVTEDEVRDFLAKQVPCDPSIIEIAFTPGSVPSIYETVVDAVEIYKASTDYAGVNPYTAGFGPYISNLVRVSDTEFVAAYAGARADSVIHWHWVELDPADGTLTVGARYDGPLADNARLNWAELSYLGEETISGNLSDVFCLLYNDNGGASPDLWQFKTVYRRQDTGAWAEFSSTASTYQADAWGYGSHRITTPVSATKVFVMHLDTSYDMQCFLIERTPGTEVWTESAKESLTAVVAGAAAWGFTQAYCVPTSDPDIVLAVWGEENPVYGITAALVDVSGATPSVVHRNTYAPVSGHVDDLDAIAIATTEDPDRFLVTHGGNPSGYAATIIDVSTGFALFDPEDILVESTLTPEQPSVAHWYDDHYVLSSYLGEPGAVPMKYLTFDYDGDDLIDNHASQTLDAASVFTNNDIYDTSVLRLAEGYVIVMTHAYSTHDSAHLFAISRVPQ